MIDLLKQFNKTNTCWIWIGELSKSGYGRFNKKSAHRLMYEIAVGRIPTGLELDHLCRNRKCVNPAHLEPVTRKENVKRAWMVRIENSPNCKHGHPLSGSNLYMVVDKKNGKTWRNCKMCKLKANKRWLARTSESWK